METSTSGQLGAVSPPLSQLTQPQRIGLGVGLAFLVVGIVLLITWQTGTFASDECSSKKHCASTCDVCISESVPGTLWGSRHVCVSTCPDTSDTGCCVNYANKKGSCEAFCGSGGFCSACENEVWDEDTRVLKCAPQVDSSDPTRTCDESCRHGGYAGGPCEGLTYDGCLTCGDNGTCEKKCMEPCEVCNNGVCEGACDVCEDCEAKAGSAVCTPTSYDNACLACGADGNPTSTCSGCNLCESGTCVDVCGEGLDPTGTRPAMGCYTRDCTGSVPRCTWVPLLDPCAECSFEGSCADKGCIVDRCDSSDCVTTDPDTGDQVPAATMGTRRSLDADQATRGEFGLAGTNEACSCAAGFSDDDTSGAYRALVDGRRVPCATGSSAAKVECTVDDTCPCGLYFGQASSQCSWCASDLGKAQHPMAQKAHAECMNFGDSFTYKGEKHDCHKCYPLENDNNECGAGGSNRYFLSGGDHQGKTMDQCSSIDADDIPPRSCVSCSKLGDDVFSYGMCHANVPDASMPGFQNTPPWCNAFTPCSDYNSCTNESLSVDAGYNPGPELGDEWRSSVDACLPAASDDDYDERAMVGGSKYFNQKFHAFLLLSLRSCDTENRGRRCQLRPRSGALQIRLAEPRWGILHEAVAMCGRQQRQLRLSRV